MTEGRGLEPGRVGLLLCPLIWGASFIVAKVALKTTTPMYLTLLRMMIASATFLPIMLWYTARGVRLKASHLPMVVWLGFLGFAGYFWIQYTAVRLTSPGSVALIITLSPVWTALIASLIYRERVGLRKLCGIGVAFAGALLVSVGPLLNGSAGVTGADANHLLGAGLALVNTIGWAVYTTTGRRVVASYPPVFITSWIAIAGTALTVLLTFVTGDIYRPLPSDPSVWFAALFLGVLCSTVAYSAWYGALKYVDSATAASFLYLEPVVTVILERVYLGGPITSFKAVGALLIISGVSIISKAQDVHEGVSTKA